MFTGLIETRGRIAKIDRKGRGATLTITAPPKLVSELTLGESVAVDGACLTVTHSGSGQFRVDASSETMERTTLQSRKINDEVHLERALRLGDRLGGHWVTGHIDAVGTLRSQTPLGEAVQMWFNAPAPLMRYLVSKGSIAIDGASLTVNEVDQEGFSVVVIPHTQGVLNLTNRRPSSSVNLEMDLIGKYVERLLSFQIQGSTINTTSISKPYAPEHGKSHTALDLSILAKTGFLK